MAWDKWRSGTPQAICPQSEDLGLALQTSMVDRCLILGYQSLRGDLDYSHPFRRSTNSYMFANCSSQIEMETFRLAKAWDSYSVSISFEI